VFTVNDESPIGLLPGGNLCIVKNEYDAITMQHDQPISVGRNDKLLLRLQAIHGEPRYDIPPALQRGTV
jgi:hypothetical protein